MRTVAVPNGLLDHSLFTEVDEVWLWRRRRRRQSRAAPDTSTQVLASLEQFQPSRYGLPPYEADTPAAHGSCAPAASVDPVPPC